MKFIDQVLQATTSCLTDSDSLKIFKERKLHSAKALKKLKHFPPRNEQWKYTHFSHLNDLSYVSQDISDLQKNENTSFHLFFNDGICQFKSDNPLLPKGVVIQNFKKWYPSSNVVTDRTQQKALGEYFLENSFPKEAIVDHLNMLLCRDIYLITVEPHTVIDTPLHLHFQGQTSNMTGLRVFFDIQSGSQVKVVWHINEGWNQGPSVFSVFCKARLDVESQMDMYCRQDLSSTSTLFMQNTFDLIGKGCALNYVDMFLGEGKMRSNGIVHLNGRDVSANIHALSLLKQQAHLDTHFYIDHHYPNTCSRLKARSVLLDNSRYVFNGWVGIDRKAQKADSDQSSKALVLSPFAEADVKPELDIFADNVKATHGATVGQINEEDVFYLQSRGLSYQEALKCLSTSFLQSLLTKIKDKDLQSKIEEDIMSYLKVNEKKEFP